MPKPNSSGLRVKLRALFDRALFALSCLTLRRKNRWVFVGWHTAAHGEMFADNAKYLFLHVANTRPEIEAIWLAKDNRVLTLLRERGYHSFHERSLSGMWAALTAGTTVIDAFLQPYTFRFVGRSRLVQLLHGKGMKKGGYAEKPRRVQDVIFSTSPFVSDMLPPVFVQNTPTVVAGYPRGDVFFHDLSGNDIDVDQETKKLLGDPRYQKRLLYAPTFRRGQKELDLEKTLDLERLSLWLNERSYLLVMSLHPKYANQIRGLSYPNIHFLPDSDIYPLLPQIDLMITDYSSLFTDYLLLDRPIVFYAYDLEDYKKNEGLSFNSYDEYTPGPKAYTFDELLSVLEKTLAHDEHTGERARVRTLYHTFPDGESAKRIVDYLTDAA